MFQFKKVSFVRFIIYTARTGLAFYPANAMIVALDINGSIQSRKDKQERQFLFGFKRPKHGKRLLTESYLPIQNIR